MEVKHYQSPDGNWFKEIICRQACVLKHLQEQYNNIGKKTWFNPYDSERWMLTVLIGKEI